FKFMILGMSAVFLFLILMVYVLKLQHIIIAKFFPEKDVNLDINQNLNDKNKLDDTIVAVIISAIQHFKISQKGR
ncbi:MAG: OadG family protein, partial [Gallicola sp.]|nr:OadG family protein [Gallicola sp.]